MSPEQLAGEEVTFRSDLYALGLILYEMFTGRRFFDARTLEELHTPAPRGEGAAALERLPAARPGRRARDRALPRGGSGDGPPRRAPCSPCFPAATRSRPPWPPARRRRRRWWRRRGRSAIWDRPPAWPCLLCRARRPGAVGLPPRQDRRCSRKASLPKTPEVLVERARDVLIAARLRTTPPADWAYSFDWDRAYVEQGAAPRSHSRPRGRRLARPRSPRSPSTTARAHAS